MSRILTDISILQAVGAAAALVYTSAAAWVVFRVRHATMGLRVTREEELQGLDIGEHGVQAYPEFGLMSAQANTADD